MRTVFSAVIGWSLFAAVAAADPLSAGNAATGKALHDAKCTGCHGTEVYARADRKVRSPKALIQRVALCDSNFVDGLTPQEELDVAAYLNREFYRFK